MPPTKALSPVLRALRGVIDSERTQGGGRGGLSDDCVAPTLRRIYSDRVFLAAFAVLTAAGNFGTVADPGDRAAISLKMRKNAKKPCGNYTFCADPGAKIRLFLKVPSRNDVKITVTVLNAMKCDKCYTLQ